MSQFTKTIKMALKSTEEERAILRARSAVQRFPVVEWRQRMEDFHKRSIYVSRSAAGPNAFRASDCDGGSGRPIGEHDDWNPEYQAQPAQPAWDAASLYEGQQSPRTPGPPGSPGQWSQDTLNPPRLAPDGRRGSFGTDVSDNEGDYQRPSMDARPDQPQEYGNFLERANKTIAKDHKHAADPFLDAAPSRPFGAHSRASSVESIASIVDERDNSPLNKAIVDVSDQVISTFRSYSTCALQFTDADGGVTQDFVAKLQHLDAHNSKHELSIEKYLMKSEERFFDKVKKDKLSSAASVRSSKRDSTWGTPAPSSFDHSRPSCTRLYFALCPPLADPFSSAPSTSAFTPGIDPYNSPMGNESSNDVVVMSGLQIAVSREIFGWPIYTIVIAAGQVRSSQYALRRRH